MRKLLKVKSTFLFWDMYTCIIHLTNVKFCKYLPKSVSLEFQEYLKLIFLSQ